MAELQPYEIRDKVLGVLAKKFPLARTRDEIAADSGVDSGLVNRELVHLIQAEYLNWYGQQPDDPRTILKTAGCGSGGNPDRLRARGTAARLEVLIPSSRRIVRIDILRIGK